MNRLLNALVLKHVQSCSAYYYKSLTQEAKQRNIPANKSTLWERLTYVARTLPNNVVQRNFVDSARRPLNVMINVTIWRYYNLATTFEVCWKYSEFIQLY